MGDFNGQLGNKCTGEYILGKHSNGKRNDNGQRLMNFCFEHNLKITNTFYKKKHNRRWTWISPNGKVRNEIDYIATNIPKIFSDVATVNNFNFNSDHRLLRGTIICKDLKISRRKYNQITSRTITLVSKQELKEIKESLDNIKEQCNVQDKYDILEKSILKVLEYSRKNTKDKLGIEARTKIEERKELFNHRKKNRKKIAKISKEISKSIRNHRKKIRLETIREQIQKTGGIKKALKELKEHSNWIAKTTKKDYNMNMHSTTKRQEIIKTATEFYRNLYTDMNKTTDKTKEDNGTDHEITPHIMQDEVRKAIETQKAGKAPGDDNISNELLKYTMEQILEPFTNICNEIMTSEQIPSQ